MVSLFAFPLSHASTIESLFKDLYAKVQSHDFEGINSNVYFLSRSRGRSNLSWFLDGIRNPSQGDADNGFTDEALLKVLENSDKFFPIRNIYLYHEFLKAFDRSFEKANQQTSFYKDLQNEGRNIFVLYPTDKAAYVIVYKDEGEFKLIWWKHLNYISKYLQDLKPRKSKNEMLNKRLHTESLRSATRIR